MIQKAIHLALIVFGIGAICALAQSPTPVPKASVIPGEVASINESKIVINTKDGALEASLSPKTEYKKVLPDSPGLSGATATTFSEIGVGDKVVITGILSADKKSVPAKTVYLMTKADISQKRAKEVEEWKTRGITGKVTAVNPSVGQITVEVRGLAGTSSIVLTPKEKAMFRRYAPDSIRFDESLVSSLEEVKPGDMLRALGDKSADGSSFAAEEVLTGAFQTVAGTVKSVDTAKNEIIIQDLRTKKELTVALSGAVLLKRFPAEQAERMASMQAGGGDGPRPPAPMRPRARRPARGAGQVRRHSRTATTGLGRRGPRSAGRAAPSGRRAGDSRWRRRAGWTSGRPGRLRSLHRSQRGRRAERRKRHALMPPGARAP